MMTSKMIFIGGVEDTQKGLGSLPDATS